MLRIENYINGEFIQAKGNKTLDVYDPSVGKVYATAPDSDKPEVELAVKAAEEAFATWRNYPVNERHKILVRIADLIGERLEELAGAESRDNGKPLWLAKKVDIPRASANMRFFANAITQFSSESHDMGEKGINYTLRQPLGVVVCISPWNLPLYLFTWKIAPALAAGNTVVAKPSEVTPYTAWMFSKICQEAGLPKGVLNILHGYGHKIGPSLVSHKKVKAISFTGSTKVGREIAGIAGPLLKKVSLELGGKNPNLIFADCDYDTMLKTTVNSSFSNQGQICLCGSRIYIESSVYLRFKKDLVERAARLIVGHPTNPDTKIGPVVSKPHFDKIVSYIELAKKEGGVILTGGKAIKPIGSEEGWYIEPTVIEGLSNSCRVNQEEIFGPVVTIQPFDTEEEALQLANDTEYGLSTTIWTENLSRAHRLARDIDAGIVWINTWLNRDLRTPFGGMKNSGLGREGGQEALRFFTEPKNVCISL